MFACFISSVLICTDYEVQIIRTEHCCKELVCFFCAPAFWRSRAAPALSSRPPSARILLPTRKRRRCHVDIQLVCPNPPEPGKRPATRRRACRTAHTMLHQSCRRARARRTKPSNPSPDAPFAVADSVATKALFCLFRRPPWPRRAPQAR